MRAVGVHTRTRAINQRRERERESARRDATRRTTSARCRAARALQRAYHCRPRRRFPRNKFTAGTFIVNRRTVHLAYISERGTDAAAAAVVKSQHLFDINLTRVPYTVVSFRCPFKYRSKLMKIAASIRIEILITHL